ncbi:unnamed protein product [Arctogadus glacialis]
MKSKMTASEGSCEVSCRNVWLRPLPAIYGVYFSSGRTPPRPPRPHLLYFRTDPSSAPAATPPVAQDGPLLGPRGPTPCSSGRTPPRPPRPHLLYFRTDPSSAPAAPPPVAQDGPLLGRCEQHPVPLLFLMMSSLRLRGGGGLTRLAASKPQFVEADGPSQPAPFGPTTAPVYRRSTAVYLPYASVVSPAVAHTAPRHSAHSQPLLCDLQAPHPLPHPHLHPDREPLEVLPAQQLRLQAYGGVEVGTLLLGTSGGKALLH